MMEHMLLDVKNLSVSYGENHIIRNAHFSMQRGEFVALLGLNGSGKTTLLRAICGLKKTSAGSCFMEGEDSLRFHEMQRARLISYIPQHHSIIYDTSVIDVVLMGFNSNLRFFQTPGKKEHLLAVQALEKLGLEKSKDENFLHLSEGQKQLVILARSMVQKTPVMILDEPDSALDYVNRHMVLNKIRDTVHREGRCALITLQNPNFALQYCDKLLLLSCGSISTEISTKASTADIKNSLTKIYGRIDIIEYEGGRVMVKG